MTLSTLAAESLGDAHGLDEGRPLATLVKRALSSATPELPADEIWAGQGVLVGGGITSTALVLNLRAAGDRATAAIVNTAAGEGEPLYLTLRQILQDGPAWARIDGPISVCENPAVVAEAANTLGADCSPLICTRGQPSLAVTTLLARLREAGSRLRYHGDFDWPGIRIANSMIKRHRAVPWRMSAEDYLAASGSGKALTGSPSAAEWDSDLTTVMQTRGQVIEEERVIQDLLADLN
jgi:uncharacterized protein (TIGR02679 family)